MKSRMIFLVLTGGLLLSACSPATPIVEDSAVEVVEEVVEVAVDESMVEEDAIEPESNATDNASETVSFSKDVWPIIEKYALDAHGGKGGIFLENYADILSTVEPGNPEASLLYRALIGDGVKQMPPGNPLPEELIDTIYNWIKQGAKDN